MTSMHKRQRKFTDETPEWTDANPWRSIETAPKDGSKVWGYSEGDALEMFWHAGFEAFITSFRRMTYSKTYTLDGDDPLVGQDEYGAWYRDHSAEIAHVKHWMPQPVPPHTA